MSTSVLPVGRAPTTAQRRDAIEALYATGHWLYSQERYKDAACVFRAMVHVSPRDERGWLALGACHEALDQASIALEMYGTARVIARPAPRCEIARARVLRARGEDDLADAALNHAEQIAEAQDDDEVRALVRFERGRP
jgi:cytochrome c-type biogenesis protein CcmH/NrfG